MRTSKIYFATCPIMGRTVQLKAVFHKGADAVAKNFRGTCPICAKAHKVDRIIRRPLEASNHECDARCLQAKGEHCQCKCGGENHGTGGLEIVSMGVA